MEGMELAQMAALLEDVWEEERRQMEGLYMVVHPSEEAQVRKDLDEAGYEPVQIITNEMMEPGKAMIMREPDFEDDVPMFVNDPLFRQKPRRSLWRRIRDSIP